MGKSGIFIPDWIIAIPHPSRQKVVYALLRDKCGVGNPVTLTPAQIAAATGRDECSAKTILKNLVRCNLLQRDGNGQLIVCEPKWLLTYKPKGGAE